MVRTLGEQKGEPTVFNSSHHILDDKICAALVMNEGGADVLYADPIPFGRHREFG